MAGTASAALASYGVATAAPTTTGSDDIPSTAVVAPGGRVRIKYYDHNDLFGEQLPILATVLRRILGEGRNTGILVSLDRPIEWDGQSYGLALLLQHWEGYPVGGREEAAAHFLIIRDAADVGENFQLETLDPRHLAWVLVTPA